MRRNTSPQKPRARSLDLCPGSSKWQPRHGRDGGSVDFGADSAHAADMENDTHSLVVGYILWLFGFTGSHRFYFGKPISGTIWFFTLGLLGVGWLIDLLLMPGLDRSASRRFRAGRLDYTVAWVLLTFLGLFGVHRFYLGKWVTGLLYLVSAGLFGFGYLYDLWTLNEQVSEQNA